MDEAGRKKYLREYYRQLKRQEDAINNMSAQEFADARRKFLIRGRNPKAKNAQKNYRIARTKEIEENTYDRIRKNKPDGDAIAARIDAEKRANEVMDSLRALHEPDMVAGGWHKPEPTGLGDKDVNSSIGAHWGSRRNEVDKNGRKTKRSRADILGDKIEEAVARGDGSDIMNVELTICPPGKKG